MNFKKFWTFWELKTRKSILKRRKVFHPMRKNCICPHLGGQYVRVMNLKGHLGQSHSALGSQRLYLYFSEREVQQPKMWLWLWLWLWIVVVVITILIIVIISIIIVILICIYRANAYSKPKCYRQQSWRWCQY